MPVPATLSPAGVKLIEAVEEFESKKEPARIIYLKARQVWVSAAVASLFYKLVRFNPGWRCQIVADSEKNAKNIAGYYQQYDQTLELPCVGKETLGTVGGPTKNQYGWWQWEGGSEIIVQTARNVQSGRSFSARLLHLSEFAFYQDAATLSTGLMQAMAKSAGTIGVVESTANGYGGEFHRLWQLAMGEGVAVEWADDMAWKGLFFGWHEHPEYRKQLKVPPDQFQNSMSKAERSLMENQRCDLEQLQWRRWTIANDCMGDERRFQQEYPATPEEAFLTSGRTRFDMGAVSRMPVDRAPLIGTLERVTLGPQQVIQFVPNPAGWLKVFRRPTIGHQYVFGIDTAQGLDPEDAQDPDWSVGHIVDRETGEQAATAWGQFTPEAFAEICYLVGEWYGWAFMVPESNNQGAAFIMKTRDLDYPLDRIYHKDADPRHIGAGKPNEIGFLTTVASRPVLIATLASAIREQWIIVYNSRTISELRTFVTTSSGKDQAQQGSHDDEVMALALACVGISAAPHFVKPQPKLTALRPIDYLKDKRKQDKRGVVVRVM